MTALTPLQLRVFHLIRDWTQTRGYAPSCRQIATMMGHHSPSSAHRLVDALCRAGYLRRETGKARGLSVLFWEGGEPNWEQMARRLEGENQILKQRLSALGFATDNLRDQAAP